MRTLIESDGTLLVQAPTWLGLAFIGVGVALTVFALFFRKVPRSARMLAFLGTMVLLYGGWYMLSTKITFESRGFYVETMYGEEERVGWLRVTSMDAGGLTNAKGSDPGHLAFQLSNSREVSVNLSDLSSADQQRIVAFAKERLKR